MAASVYTIQRSINGGAWGQDKTFPDALCLSAVRKLVNQGADTCTLTFSGLRPPHLGGFKVGEYIRILRDGTGWFTGRVIAPERTADGPSESTKLTLYGPWWELANIVYQQAGLFYSLFSETDNPTVEQQTINGPVLTLGNALLGIDTVPTVQLSSTVILTQGEVSGIPLDADATVNAALDYAISLGARLQVGQVDVNLAIPAEQLTDPTCADCVKRVLRWTPGQTCYFDYTTDPPTCYVRNRGNRPTILLQMGGNAPVVKTATLAARPDLVLPGVTIQYLRRIEVQQAATATAAGVNTTLNVLQVETAGPQPVGIGSLVATIELTGGSVALGSTTASTSSGQTFEPTPVGLAAALYAARSAVPFEGRISLVGSDIVSGGNWLGRTVNISGGDAEWLKMAADVQTCEENTATGATTLNVGPPDHLGASDLAALLKANRLRMYVDPVTSTLRTSGGTVTPPIVPPPQPPPSPTRNPGNSGPSNAPDGGTTTQSGFTGLIYTYAGSNIVPWHAVGNRFAPNPMGSQYQQIETPPPLPDGSDSSGEQPTGGTTPTFYATLSYGIATDSQSYAPAGTVPAGVPEQWVSTSTSASTHSEGTLDLSSFSPLNYIYAELRGTLSRSGQPDAPYQVPVTGLLGLRTPGFRVYAQSGTFAKQFNDSVNGGGKTASLQMTGGLYLVARGKKVGG